MSEERGAVLITGCSSGIGRESAAHLSKKGWRVYATARRLESLAELEAQGCRTLALDVDDEDSMRAAVASVEEAEGGIAGLVNNAGYSQSGAIESVPIERVRAQFETNVFGLIRMCQLVLPGMRRAGSGRIVNVGSMGGRLTFPGGGAYHATKHAVEAISDALRFEVAGFGVQVSLIEPGLIKTGFADTAAGSLGAAQPGGASPSERETQGADDPYGAFNAHVGAATVGAYEGGLSRFGAGPEAVAKVIERALTNGNPRPRYRVTPSAHLIMAQRRLLPDRAWDAVLRSQFPTPGR